MRRVTRASVAEPVRGPNGEVIYEMIGKPHPLGGTVNHSFVHVSVEPGGSSQAHYHVVSEETYFGLTGSGLLRVGGDECRLMPGVAVLIMPGEVHQIVNDTEADLEFIAISAPAWVPEDTKYVSGDDAPHDR